MDYEKKYKEALERARKSYVNSIEQGWTCDKVIYEEIFPELKESEDERIRKTLIKGFQYYDKECKWGEFTTTEILDWLEKQGEEKLLNNDKYQTVSVKILDRLYESEKELKQLKQGEQKPADKVEPKFHQGEWITNGDYTWKIIEVKPLDYILQSQDGNIVDDTTSHVDEQFHSFTIEDAKEGDVLVGNDAIIIFRKIGNHILNDVIDFYICYSFEMGIIIQRHNLHCGFIDNVFFKPATKEQRKLLFQKMKEEGYEWNLDKLELKKLSC